MPLNSTKILLILSSVYFMGCGNPVTPTGGPKDNEPPKIKTIHFDTTSKKYTKIQIEFDENITVKGQITASPKSSIKPIINRNKLSFDVPKEAKTIFIKNKIVDLNESNPYNGSNISLTHDSGVILLKNLTKENKLTVFIKKDTFIYIPQTDKNDYQFENLNFTENSITIINNDNNNYSIDKKEDFLILPIENRFYSRSDTIRIHFLHPRIASFDKQIKIDSQLTLTTKTLKHYSNLSLSKNIFCQNDTCTELLNTQKNIFNRGTHYYYLKNKDTLGLTEIYKSDQIKYSIKSPIQTTATKQKITKLSIPLGLLHITKPDTNTVYVYLKNEKNQFIIQLNNTTTDSMYLPVGNYQCYSSYNNLYNDEISAVSENLYYYKDQVIINSKLENNLILPKKELYNTGITFK